MAMVTYTYRIKDSSCRKHLTRMARSVNFVWNYCNETSLEYIKKHRKFLSGYDLNRLTKGCSVELGIMAQTICAVGENYAKARELAKTRSLSWRSNSKSLGWIPFKTKGIHVANGSIMYYSKRYKFWESRIPEGKLRCGSFNEDARGRWYVNLVYDVPEKRRVPLNKCCGIDLGVKAQVTVSDGVKFERRNFVIDSAEELAMTQRAKKKKRVASIHSKIRNRRKDWNQKVSAYLTSNYDEIFIGNASSSRLKKGGRAKGVSDAGWYQLKSMIKFKSERLGLNYKEVNENYSTVTCSNCLERTGPSGLSGLGVREWTCCACGAIHDRDVNAAKNILRIGHDTPIKGIQA